MVKVISLSNEAYGKLKAIKRDRSFSEIVIEIIDTRNEKKDIMKFAGVWKDRIDEWKEIEKRIYEDRKKFKLREVKI